MQTLKEVDDYRNSLNSNIFKLKQEIINLNIKLDLNKKELLKIPELRHAAILNSNNIYLNKTLSYLNNVQKKWFLYKFNKFRQSFYFLYLFLYV
jgi:hypothetical protein